MINDKKEFSDAFHFKKMKSLTKREQKNLNKEKPTFEIDFSGDKTIKKGSTGNLIINIKYSSLYEYSNLNFSITSKEKNRLSYFYGIDSQVRESVDFP